MQVFRLMGAPDKIIAFDELPKRLLADFELVPATGFPKYWKQWMGTMKKLIPIMPERDGITGGVIHYKPVEEEDSYFYVVDWTLKKNEEGWKRIEEYVRMNVPDNYRLNDKLESLAKPLARDKSEGLSLEPDDVAVIPLKKDSEEFDEEKNKDLDSDNPLSKFTVTCDYPGCGKDFMGSYARSSLRLHKATHERANPNVEKIEKINTSGATSVGTAPSQAVEQSQVVSTESLGRQSVTITAAPEEPQEETPEDTPVMEKKT